MADLVTRMRVDSSEYDQKIKRAAENLSIYADQCRKVGGTLEVVEKETLEYVKSLGQMETVSRSAAGKLAELKKAYTDMSVQYKLLTDEEKQSPFGRALSSQLDQLKTRINDAKTNLAEVSRELGGSGGGGLGGALDSIAGKFGMSISSLAGWGAALAAAKGAMDVAKDAFNANEASVDEWGRTVASVTGLYEGFLTALNTGDISGYISRMDNIAKAAQNVYNALDALGTMKTIQTPEMSERQTETERLRTMIRTGHYLAPENQQYATPGLNEGDKLTKEQIRTYEQELKNNMKELVQLNKNEIEQSTTAIDAIYKKMALQLGISLEEFREGTKNWAAFSEKMEGAERYRNFEKTVNAPSMTSLYAHGVGATDKAPVTKVNPDEQYKAWSVFRVDKEGEGSYKELVNLIKQRDQQEMQTLQMRGQMYQTINRAEGFTVRKLLGGTGDGSTTKTKTELQQNEAAISKLTEEYQQLATAAKTADEAQQAGITERQNAIRQEIGTLQERNNELKRFAQEAKGISVNIGVNSSLPELTAHLSELQKAQNQALNPQEWQDYQKQIEQTNIQIDALKGKWKEGTDATFSVSVNDSEAYDKLKNLPNVLVDEDTITIKADTAQAYAEIQKLVAGIEGMTVTFNVKPQMQQGINIQNSAGLSQYISGLKKDLETANFGSDLYNSIATQLSDTSMLQSLVSESLKAGLGTALFDVADETGKDFWTRAMEGGVEDVDWQSIADKINERRKAMKLDPIELDFKTGKTKEKKNEQTPLEETKQVVSGLSTVASGLQAMGIELPKGVQSVLSGIQGLMSVINGVTSIIQVFSTTTSTAQTVSINGNTAAVSALTAAVIANTAAVGAQTLTSSMGGGFLGWMLGFSNGGIVGKAANGMVIPGNSFSGDKLRMPVLDGGGFIGVNSGEVILNRAQAGVIASDLQGIGQQQGVGGGTPYTTGENIVLGINNWGRRTGRGELVFSRG